MSRRRARTAAAIRSRGSVHPAVWVVLGVVVLGAGFVAGTLVRARLSSDVVPAPSVAVPEPAPPTAEPGPAPAAEPAPITPAVVTIDQTVLDGAVTRALAGLGSVRWLSADRLAERLGNQEFRWVRRRVEVTVRVVTADAVATIRREVDEAGGKVLSRSADLVRVGLVRSGQPLVTHEIRLLASAVQGPRAAVIFDDAGGDLGDLEAILALHRPVTIAVLPGLRFSREVAERARAAGLEVLLHLPMEADDASKALGPGGVTVAMTDEEIAAVVREDLAGVPGAIGVNNHMGSRGSANERVMRAVLGVVRERRMIFVDSRTTLNTVGARLAVGMGIPVGERAVFLDNEDTPDAIRTQITRLLAQAVQRGQVIAIGHAHRQTAKVLAEMLAEFVRQGIQLVPVSAIVH